MGPLSPGSVRAGTEWRDHLAQLRRRLLCGIERRHARSARSRARQDRLQVGRQHECRGDRDDAWPPHAQCVHRPPGRQPVAGCEGGHRADQACRRQGLGHRRLSRGHLAPSARCAGAAHAGARHRRAVVLHRPHRPHAGARHDSAGDAAAQLDTQRADQARRPERRRGRAHRGGCRRCRHPQSHQLQAAGARRLLSRPAPADRRSARSLRPAHRWHAGRARADPFGRRYRRNGIIRLASGASAVGALFRHRARRA